MSDRTCSIDGCAQQAKSAGLCGMHYARQREHGDPGPATRLRAPWGKPNKCNVGECDRPARARGMCNTHYERWRTTGVVGAAAIQPHRVCDQTCHMEGCDQPQKSSKGLCNKHYVRWRIWGDPYYDETARGIHHVNWLGDAVGYVGVHERVRSLRGRPSEYLCVECGHPACDWAYDHCDPDERVSPEGWPYSLDLDRYQSMCRTCHVRLDTRG